MLNLNMGIICIVGLLLYVFVFITVLSGHGLSCQLTSNTGHDSVLVDLHQPLVLNCSTSQRNKSNLTFLWKKRDRKLLKNVSASVFNTTNVRWDDAGNYECTIKGGPVNELCNITVKVKAKPHVRLEPYDELRRTMILSCLIEGYFNPDKITWYKNGKHLSLNETAYVVENKTYQGGFVFHSKLKKKNPDSNDAGNYTCEARNKYGISRTYTYVRKYTIACRMPKNCPEFKNKSTEINVTISLGSSTTLSCKVIYVPCIRFHPVLLVGKVVNNTLQPVDSNKSTIQKNYRDRIWSMNYTIVNAEKNDSGRYVCRFLHADIFHCPHNSLTKVFNINVLVPVQVSKRKLNLILVIAVSVSGALCGLGLVLYVRHLKRKLKAQFYDNCPDNSPELRWDVFVSYSSHDFAWVSDLCQMLEKPPFNLIVCLHQRDWELGRSVVDNMVDSVYCSQKTLIILSRHYVESEYCMQELQIALHSELSTEPAGRNDRIILIKIDDVSMRSLPRVLRQKSYLDCSDREHAKHLKTNLLRALPRRRAEAQNHDLEEAGDDQSEDESDGSGTRFNELQMV